MAGQGGDFPEGRHAIILKKGPSRVHPSSRHFKLPLRVPYRECLPLFSETCGVRTTPCHCGGSNIMKKSNLAVKSKDANEQTKKLKWEFSKGSGVVPKQFSPAQRVEAAAAPGGADLVVQKF